MTESRDVTARPLIVAQVTVVILLALRIYFDVVTPPIGDEAYYWMWGQKLDWSYFDHPPLHAWLLRLMSILFGWNLFSLRALTWFTLGGTLWVMWLMSKRLKPEDPAVWFWPSAAVYLGSRLFFLMTSIVFNDHLLIFLCLASAYAFLVFTEKWEATGRSWIWLYAGAALLGLAVLTKYNGVLFGIGIAAFFVVRRPLRPLWRSPHLYLAALLSVAMQAPVLYWNATRHFASYEFHLSERWDATPIQFHPLGVLTYIAVAISYLSPLLLPPLVRMFRTPLGQPFADRSRTMALTIFCVSSLVMLVLSAFVDVFFYWNITAFLLLMPLFSGWMNRRWMLNSHVGYGLFAAAIAVVDLSVIPLGNLTGHYDWTISSMYGWPQVAERVKVLEQQEHTSFIAVTRYTTAAQLGFAMRDPEVTAISDRPDQYDFWFKPAEHEGQDAIVVSDPVLGLEDVAPYFDSLTPLETVPYTTFGRTLYEPTIYLGKRFHAEAKRS